MSNSNLPQPRIPSKEYTRVVREKTAPLPFGIVGAIFIFAGIMVFIFSEENLLFCAVFVGLGLLSFVTCVVSQVKYIKAKKLRKRLKQEGRLVRATVTDTQRDGSYIICYDENNNRYESEYVHNFLDPYIGRQVKIYVNLADEDSYCVDLDDLING